MGSRARDRPSMRVEWVRRPGCTATVRHPDRGDRIEDIYRAVTASPVTFHRRSPGRPADRATSCAILARSRSRNDPRFEELFAGSTETTRSVASPAWVAERRRPDRRRSATSCGGSSSGPTARSVEAVRAVDTATHPDYQGRGIFTRLTLRRSTSCAPTASTFVFNTPNDQSRPGYLKMGWHEVGRAPRSVRPRSLSRRVRLARARVPADQWSLPCDAGEPAVALVDAADELGDAPRDASRGSRRSVRPTLARVPRLALRDEASLEYRGLVRPAARTRACCCSGSATGRAVRWCSTSSSHRRPIGRRPGCWAASARVAADYVIRDRQPAVSHDGFVRLPRQGPDPDVARCAPSRTCPRSPTGT